MSVLETYLQFKAQVLGDLTPHPRTSLFYLFQLSQTFAGLSGAIILDSCILQTLGHQLWAGTSSYTYTLPRPLEQCSRSHQQPRTPWGL